MYPQILSKIKNFVKEIRISNIKQFKNLRLFSSKPIIVECAGSNHTLDLKRFFTTIIDDDGSIRVVEIKFVAPKEGGSGGDDDDDYIRNLFRSCQKFFKGITLKDGRELFKSHFIQLGANDPIEDRYTVNNINNEMILFGVYDGHAGPQCADFLSKKFMEYFSKNLPLAKNKADALRRTYEQLDDHIGNVALTAMLKAGPAGFRGALDEMMTTLSGAVSIHVLAEKNRIHVAHTGDCRAVIARRSAGKWTAFPLTEDHDVLNEADLRRLRKQHPGEDVVLGDRLLGLIQPVRTFGDFRLKWPRSIRERVESYINSNGVQFVSPKVDLKSPPYLTAEPDIKSYEIKEEDQCLIIASDGHFNNLKNYDTVEALSVYLEGVEKNGWVCKDQNAAAHLLRNGTSRHDRNQTAKIFRLQPPEARKFRDDTTIFVVFLKDNLELTDALVDSLESIIIA